MKKIVFFAAFILAVAVFLVLAVTGKTDNFLIVGTFFAVLIISAFLISFESRRASVQELMPIVVVSALCSVGRVIFAFIPQFQPVTALVMLMGICYGARAGAMTGVLTALVSNMMLGQGIWTLWQMIGWGLVGLLAGLLKDKKAGESLWAVMALSVPLTVLYSVVVDAWTITSLSGSIKTAGAIILTGLAFNIPHAVGNFIFLGLLYKPITAKLKRIKSKYAQILN